MATFTVSGVGHLPDGSPLVGSWVIGIYSSTSTGHDGAAWTAGVVAYDTAEDGALSIALPQTDGSFMYTAVFRSHDYADVNGPRVRGVILGQYLFDLTANKTWQQVMDTPTLAPLTPALVEQAEAAKTAAEQARDDALAAKVEAEAARDAALAATPPAVPDATETVEGIVELATPLEATSGTDTARAVTPAGVKAALASTTNLPAGSTLTVQKATTWPARPTSRADITVIWKGADPSPAIVSSGTGGMLDGVDVRMVTS